MTKAPTYITMDDALRLARELHPSTTFNQLYNYLNKCGLKGRWPNRTKLGGRLFRPQEYRRLEVLELLAGFSPPRPKLEKIYRATQRPGEGWMKAKDLARITGAKYTRISAACGNLAIPGRIYGRTLYTRYAEATEYLAWRRPLFVRRHMSDEWIAQRRAEMKKNKMVPPPDTAESALWCNIRPRTHALMKKLKEVSMKKALETLGATDIKVLKKGYWFVSGQFTLNGKRYRYGSLDLRTVVIPGKDDIDLTAEAPLYYHEQRGKGTFGNNRFDLNERFAAVGVRVPMSKHEYDPWNAWKRTPKNPKPLKTCGTCANYESGICRATGNIRSVHSLDICRWNKYTPLTNRQK